jgi:hypothetical protein
MEVSWTFVRCFVVIIEIMTMCGKLNQSKIQHQTSCSFCDVMTVIGLCFYNNSTSNSIVCIVVQRSRRSIDSVESHLSTFSKSFYNAFEVSVKLHLKSFLGPSATTSNYIHLQSMNISIAVSSPSASPSKTLYIVFNNPSHNPSTTTNQKYPLHPSPLQSQTVPNPLHFPLPASLVMHHAPHPKAEDYVFVRAIRGCHVMGCVCVTCICDGVWEGEKWENKDTPHPRHGDGANGLREELHVVGMRGSFTRVMRDGWIRLDSVGDRTGRFRRLFNEMRVP